MKTMQEFKFLAFVNIFLQTRDQKKKMFWTKNNEKTKKRLCEICQNLLLIKTFMITQNKGEWPTCLALTSVTEQFSN